MRPWAALVGALALGSCAQSSAPLPARPVAQGPAITIEAAPIEEFQSENGQTVVPVFADGGGASFVWVGGMRLTSPDTARLHGLSDLRLLPGNRLVEMGQRT